MSFLKEKYSKVLTSKIGVLIFIILINLPLFIFTFDTTNWSDDFQYTNLLAVKAKFSPILQLIFDTTGGHIQGGHFAPAYNLFNILVTKISLNPAFFHFIVLICYILTAFFVYLIVEYYFKDKILAVLSAFIFSINYYIGFKALAWNTFHSHATNTLTGVISMYLLFRYIKEKKFRYIVICVSFFLLTILNYESGFVFFVILIAVALFSWLAGKINLKKLVTILFIVSLAMSVFPVGAYLKTGKAVPLTYRFGWTKNIQGYFFHANDLFIKSTGFSIAYNKLIFDKLKENPELKYSVKQLIRENKRLDLKRLPLQVIVFFLIFGVFVLFTVISFVAILQKRFRKDALLFIILYALLFLIYVFIFYRTDIANALSIFSSIIIAGAVISFLRDKRKGYHITGIAVLVFYALLTIWTLLDRFDDCYRKSFFGLSKVAVQGPNRIYDDINRNIGHFAKEGTIIFAHDYSSYHSSVGYERIGDTISAGDFVCYNATVYYEELLKTDIPARYKNKTFEEFVDMFKSSPDNRIVTVSNVKEAEKYLRDNVILRGGPEAVYIAKDYYVRRLNND